MITVEPCGERLEQLVRFAARLNGEAAHHIGFFGEGEADVRASLAECLIPPDRDFRIAFDDGRMAGVLGVDADPEIDRAWLFGPLVEHAHWDEVADRLYAEVLPIIPAGIYDQDIFCDAQNERVIDFALRHGFSLRSENAILTLKRGEYRPAEKRDIQVLPYQEGFLEQFEKLHRELFPNGYLTARQMAGKQDRHHRLLVAVQDGQLLGYHFCKIEPDSESGYIDFIGTAPSTRGRGVGAALLTSGLDWMLGAPSTRKINLTVNSDNPAALGLYQKFGFTPGRLMRGYRKRTS